MWEVLRHTLNSLAISGNWKPFKNDEKCYLFYLKSSFCFQDILNFCPVFLVMQKNGLIRRLRLISKFMTSQTGKQIITTHILPNISRTKNNQTMKFGHAIEYNTRNIVFLEKSYTKCVGQTSPRFVSEKSKLNMSLH